MIRKWVTRYTNVRGPSLPLASDEWGTGLPIYLNLSPEQQQQQWQQLSSIIWAALQLMKQDTEERPPRVCSSESRAWILRPALRIRGYCWLKQLSLYKWTTRIIPRVESQISGMIWSSTGMRTENTQLKAISTLCTKDQRVSQRSFGSRSQPETKSDSLC